MGDPVSQEHFSANEPKEGKSGLPRFLLPIFFLALLAQFILVTFLGLSLGMQLAWPVYGFWTLVVGLIGWALTFIFGYLFLRFKRPFLHPSIFLGLCLLFLDVPFGFSGFHFYFTALCLVFLCLLLLRFISEKSPLPRRQWLLILLLSAVYIPTVFAGSYLYVEKVNQDLPTKEAVFLPRAHSVYLLPGNGVLLSADDSVWWKLGSRQVQLDTLDIGETQHLAIDKNTGRIYAVSREADEILGLNPSENKPRFRKVRSFKSPHIGVHKGGTRWPVTGGGKIWIVGESGAVLACDLHSNTPCSGIHLTAGQGSLLTKMGYKHDRTAGTDAVLFSEKSNCLWITLKKEPYGILLLEGSTLTLKKHLMPGHRFEYLEQCGDEIFASEPLAGKVTVFDEINQNEKRQIDGIFGINTLACSAGGNIYASSFFTDSIYKMKQGENNFFRLFIAGRLIKDMVYDDVRGGLWFVARDANRLFFFDDNNSK